MPLNPTLGNQYNSRLGNAFIRIRADASRFAREARQDIQSAVNRVAASTRFQAVTAAFRNAGRRAGEAFQRAFSRAADVGSKLFAVAINKWVAGGFAAIKMLPQLIALVQQLGQVGVAAGASLPFLIVTGLLVKSVFNNAFKGVSEAITAAFDADPAKLQAALKDLTPSAQKFVLEIAKVAPELKKTQEAIQEAFFKPLTGGFAALAKTSAIRDLRGTLVAMAVDAGKAARSVLDVVTASAKSGQLGRIFGSSAQFFATITKEAPRLVKAFLNLAEAAAPFVNILGQKLVGQMERFFNFLDKSLASGKLGDAFAGALSALVGLGNLLGDVLSIIKSVFGALASSGEDVIGTFGAVTGAVADFLKSAEGTQALRTLADLLHLITTSVINLLKPLLPLVAILVESLGGTLVRALATLAPPLTKLVSALALALVPILDAVLPLIDQIVSALSDELAQVMIEVANAIYDSLPALSQLLKALGPNLTELIKAFIDINVALLPLLPVLIKAFIELLPAMIKMIPVFTTIIKLTAGLVEGIAHVVGWIVTAIGWFAKFAAPGGPTSFGNTFAWVKDIPRWFSDAGSAINRFIFDNLTSLYNSVHDFFGNVSEVFAVLPGFVGNALANLGSAIAQPFIDGFNAAYNWVANGVNSLGNAIASIPGRIASFAGRIYDAALSLGRAIGNGIANIPGFAVDIASKIVNRIKGFANDVIYDINRGIYQLSRVLPFSLPYIPYLAKGGIIDQPTLAVVGEKGREVVLPLNDPQRAQQLADQSGLSAMLSGMGDQPAPVVHVYIGDEEIVNRVDVRVMRIVRGQARELAFGSRGA